MAIKQIYRASTVNSDAPSPAWGNLSDIKLIESVLHAAARDGKALSYAETLHSLGYDFSRPKMRALCAALHEVDARARARGEPPLAVLVVRASDGLPGAGWWIDKIAATKARRRKGCWPWPISNASKPRHLNTGATKLQAQKKPAQGNAGFN